MDNDSKSSVWLIPGASRGLGLEFVRQLLRSPLNVVIATCRSPDTATFLKELVDEANSSAGKLGTVHVIQMDTADEASVKSAAIHVGKVLGADGALDYLVNNAAIALGERGSDSPLTMDAVNFVTTMTTNVIGVCWVLQQFTPFLERSKKPVVINVSSGAGSIGSNTRPGSVSYSASKSALNMVTSKFAHEKPNIITISMCPGWVKTDMGGKEAMITPEVSISGMLEVIGSLTTKDNGTFRRYNKAVVPW